MNATERRGHAASNDVLIVDDEEDIRELLELSILRMGLGADSVGTLTQARQYLETTRYRLCLTDMRLPDGDGLDLVEHIQNHYPGLPVAVITAFGSIETAIRALKLGAFDFVTKPVELQALRELVTHALKLKTPVGPSSSGIDAGEGTSINGRVLIGQSPALANLRVQIGKLARNQAPVFIQGESGTGKEVIAHFIHGLGMRAAGPFVPVNCGAISPELVESEFFGHRKASFTGATSDKDGLFQAANGGTLFLDEIGELSEKMQVKLLRAIQERAVRPVGALAEQPVDVRILSASHRDLAQLVAENHFRQDLYFRINVITLRVPPLRERVEDIPLLATHVLKRLAKRDATPTRVLSPPALAAMQRYDFPGNVRELENILERACALCEGNEISAADLGFDDSSLASHAVACGSPQATAARMPPLPEDIQPLAEDEDSGDEKARILHMLEQTRWNRTVAAHRLGITLRQLRYRLQKWGMS
jgi:two-component system response regulator PilR (NtrC family)